MEITINIIVIIFFVSIFLYVEFLMYRKPISKDEISKYQKDLNEMDKNSMIRHGLNLKHDALTEIKKEQKQIKSFVFILSGILILIALILLIFITILSYTNIFLMFTSSIISSIYGIIKLSKLNKVYRNK